MKVTKRNRRNSFEYIRNVIHIPQVEIAIHRNDNLEMSLTRIPTIRNQWAKLYFTKLQAKVYITRPPFQIKHPIHL